MSHRVWPTRGMHIVVDCILILLILMVASGYGSSAQARDTTLTEIGTRLLSPPANTQRPAAPEIDNQTLAAIIAAENAALSVTAHLLGLPMLQR